MLSVQMSVYWTTEWSYCLLVMAHQQRPGHCWSHGNMRPSIHIPCCTLLHPVHVRGQILPTMCALESDARLQRAS